MTPDLLAYYFPQYHADPRNDELVHPGWSEWEVLRASQSHFEGHRWPRQPDWGPLDEADPSVALAKVRAAQSAGLAGFVVDWYWYDGAPFLNRFLKQGLLPAAEQADFKVALMWANHPWIDLYPAKTEAFSEWFNAPTSRYSFEAATQHVIDHYLGSASYWRIEGRPYFSLYDVPDLIRAQGGVEATRRLLDGFRNRAAAVGLDLHLNIVSTRFLEDRVNVLKELGADSTTHYTWWHHDEHGFDRFPATPYSDLVRAARASWGRYALDDCPYLPNVTVGWDPSPR